MKTAINTDLSLSDITSPTDMFHVEIRLEDCFTFAIHTKHTTVSGLTLSQMLGQIGVVVLPRKYPQHNGLKLKSIRRSTNVELAEQSIAV